MDLELSDEQSAYQDRVRAWLAANLPAHPLPDVDTDDGFAAHRDWERRLAEAGFAGAAWPAAYGGSGLDPVSSLVFDDAYAEAGGPERVNHVGLNLSGPTIIALGTEEQKARWLADILSCRTIWSQALSEPDAGSDLASLRTRGRLEGDEIVVTGQKVWTTLGRRADMIYTLVRTGQDETRHRGLTVVAIDAHAPGVVRRPLVQANGAAGFAEIFFDQVRVPLDDVIGEVGDGWRVVMTTLGFERGSATNAPAGVARLVRELVEIAQDTGQVDDPVVQDRLAQAAVDAELYRLQSWRNLALEDDGRLGLVASTTKVLWSESLYELYDLGEELLGERADLVGSSSAAGSWAGWNGRAWYGRAASIYGGANEVQRNIIAERVLGLPREPR